MDIETVELLEASPTASHIQIIDIRQFCSISKFTKLFRLLPAVFQTPDGTSPTVVHDHGHSSLLVLANVVLNALIDLIGFRLGY